MVIYQVIEQDDLIQKLIVQQHHQHENETLTDQETVNQILIFQLIVKMNENEIFHKVQFHDLFFQMYHKQLFLEEDDEYSRGWVNNKKGRRMNSGLEAGFVAPTRSH